MSSPVLLLLLVILILSLSIHACNARPRGIFHNGFGKNIDNADFTSAMIPATPMKSLPDEIQTPQGESVAGEVILDHKHNGASTEKQKESDNFAMNGRTRGRVSVSGAIRIESLLTVSVRIAHEKGGERHPGFHLDYSGPQTHPPSHN